MSIQTELTRIINAKAAIKTAVEGKGVTVPAGTLLDGMAALIDAIEAGGGGGGISEIFGCSKFVVGSCIQTGFPYFSAPYPSDIFTDINKISVFAFTKQSIELDGPYFTAIAYVKRNAVTIKGYVTNDAPYFTRDDSMRITSGQGNIRVDAGTNFSISGQSYYYVMWQED